MDYKIEAYVKEFMEETTLAFYMDGKHEVKKYASYWIDDIYLFAKTLYFHSVFSVCKSELCHELNPTGNVTVEIIADSIYEELKHFKLFSYFFEIDHQHLHDLVLSMNEYIETYLSDTPTNYNDSKNLMDSLYDISIARPLPLSSYPVFSYMDENFTPDILEYEGLRRSLDSLKNVFSLSYALTERINFKNNAIEILSNLSIPLNKNVELSLTDDYIEMFFYLNGVEGQRAVRKIVNQRKYSADYSGLGLLNTLEKFLGETIFHVIGKQKEKFSEDEASYGTYPMKDLSLHGLKLNFSRFDDEKKLRLKECQSINIIKESLLIGDNPVTSTSYGADSVLVQYLVKKVYSDIDVYHGKTGLDFPEIYDVEKQLISGNFLNANRIHYGKNETSYWELVDNYGFNFERKGKRNAGEVKNDVNRSEKCCMELKHIPFKHSIDENKWDINFAGLRADESRARELAAKRDGPIYYAKSWNLYRINPIIFWSDSDVWEYTRNNEIPYASIYDMILYNDNGEVIFKPRVGCWACMLSAKYGYLKWLKEFKPKLYNHIMVDRGLLNLLYAKKLGYETNINDKGKEVVENEIEGFDPDYLMSFLEQRPCFFDDTLTKL